MKTQDEYIKDNIVEALKEVGASSPGALEKITPHRWPTLKRHLDIMAADGLVTRDVRFRQYRYKLTPKGEKLV